MRYWYIDNVNYITMMLIDKGYYDYDYKEIEKKEEQIFRKPRTHEQEQRMFSKFGFGRVKRLTDEADTSEAPHGNAQAGDAQLASDAQAEAERLQEIAMNDLEYN